jgi:hypothetical protein
MTWSLIFSAASLIIAGFSFIYFRAYIRRRTGAERILADFKEEVDKLIADIDAYTDRDAALVEDRITTLRSLLDDADRRIAVYARELGRRQTQEAAYAALGRGRKIAGAASAEPEKPREKGPLPPAGSPAVPGGNSAGAAAGDTAGGNAGSVPADTGPSAALPPEQNAAPRFVRAARDIEPAPPSFAEKAAELARAGLSPDLIAVRLGATVAEVNLALTFPRR